MNKTLTTPNTLQEAVVFFSNSNNCHDFMMNLRWPDGKVICPRCGSDNVAYLPNARVFKCYEKHSCQKFSLKVGKIFEDSPLGLEKWLPVMWMLANCKNGVSSWEIHRAVGVTQKTAWFMLQRARLAMQDTETGGKLGGEVEVDETFIGGKARNMHLDKRKIRSPEGAVRIRLWCSASFNAVVRSKPKWCVTGASEPLIPWFALTLKGEPLSTLMRWTPTKT
jgi:transposase-like protein